MQADFPRLKEEELKEKVIGAVTKWLDLPHYKIFYFGSRVKGEAGVRSDIDIGIEAPEAVPGDVMFEIQSELENLPILQKIEVVDFGSVSEDFKEVALQNIEVIYEK